MPQSFACLHTHLIFSTKNRVSSITDDVRESLHAYLVNRLEALGCKSIQINSVEDHIHLLFDLSRTLALSKAVEGVKTDSSRWMKGQGRNLATFSWQSGYAAFSVSESNVAVVRDYIANQKEHHHQRTFQDELREILKRHGIEWDERYVWD